MKKEIFKKIQPYFFCILALIVIAYSYTPQLFSGKIVNQSDISSWNGMANELVTYNNSHPDDRALWTNSMFSGMPTTSIHVDFKGDYTESIYKTLFTGMRPASYLLISLIGGFLLFLAFGVNYWLALLGAIAITFCSYNMQIIQVGHNSKMAAIAFMPWVLASVVFAYRRCGAWGALFFAFALSFQIKANHPQITYYLAIIILGFGVWQLCAAIKDKVLPKFIRVSLLLLLGGLLGIATNINHLWPVYEFGQSTMRGGSELSEASSNTEDTQQSTYKSRTGLDLNYATQWSYGISETANLLIPDFKGGSSSGELGPKSNTYKFLQNSGYDTRVAGQLPLYWGPQPFTAGPMYMGAISIFLFLLGFFVLKGGIKWWIGAVSLLSLMLSWGYHFMPASELFFNYAPLYNKFRTVSMILVVLQIMIPVMAILAVNQVLNNTDNIPDKTLKKGLFLSGGITAGFCILFAIIPSLAGDFTSQIDTQLPKALLKPLIDDRIALVRGDAFRSALFISLAFIAIYLGYLKKITPKMASIALIVLVLFDLWSVDKRYLNDSHFVTKREFSNAFTQREVDKIILQDKDPHYRVLDLSVNTFNDSYVSYHHKTIGGYCPVKLQRYQDLIERYISEEMMQIGRELRDAKTVADAESALTFHPVISMLNAKYIVIGAGNPPIENRYRLGNAWFVNSAEFVESANDEIGSLSHIDPSKTAIVNKNQFQNVVKDIESAVNQSTDSAAIANNRIEFSTYSPNVLTYKFSTDSPKAALFSEVYYSPGWRAWILDANGNKSEELNIFRANWILRGVVIPKGSGTIMFEFKPESYTKGELYSRISSGLLIILLVAGVIYMFIGRKKVKE